MELVSIVHINSTYLHYEDQRSVKCFLSRKGISVIRLGKAEYISKPDFENLISSMLDQNKTTAKTRNKSTKTQFSTEHEISLHARLMRKIS